MFLLFSLTGSAGISIKFLILAEPLSAAVDFSCTNGATVLENEAVLRFLVALAGSARDDSTAVLGHQKDSWSNAPRQVKQPYPSLLYIPYSSLT